MLFPTCKSNLVQTQGKQNGTVYQIQGDTGNSLNTFTGWTDEHYFPNNAAVTLASPNLLNPITYTYLSIIGA